MKDSWIFTGEIILELIQAFTSWWIMFPAELCFLMDFIKSKNVLRALAVIPDKNTPHLYSCFILKV